MENQDLSPTSSSNPVSIPAVETWQSVDAEKQAQYASTVVQARLPDHTAASGAEIEQMKCACCGMIEECTPSYAWTVRRAHCGKWVCGLCAEAVKEELGRGSLQTEEEDDGVENALTTHMGICMQFKKMDRKANPIADISSAMRKLLQRSMDGRMSPRSLPSSPRHGAPLARANSCLTPFSRGRGYNNAPL